MAINIVCLNANLVDSVPTFGTAVGNAALAAASSLYKSFGRGSSSSPCLSHGHITIASQALAAVLCRSVTIYHPKMSCDARLLPWGCAKGAVSHLAPMKAVPRQSSGS